MLSTYVNTCRNVVCIRRRGCYAGLLLLLAALLLLLQLNTIPSTEDASSGPHSAAGQSKPRGLLQQEKEQQEQQQELLSVLADAPDSDPFAGARVDRPFFLGRLSALLPKSLKQQLQLLKQSLWRAAKDHPGSIHAHAAALHHQRHHHKVVRHNASHTWVHSPVLQLELPQPWDATNLTKLVRDNLELDVSFWRELHRQPSYSDILDMAKQHTEMVGLTATRRLVEIRGNRLRFPLMPAGRKQFFCDEECDPQLQAFVDAVQVAVKVYNLTLPDVVFIINTNDSPVCTEEQAMRDECRAPVISLSKEAGVADLVGPVMKPEDADVHLRHMPWDAKLDKAFFRGVPSCGQMPFPPACARSWIARMAQLNNSQDLDAGLVEEYGRADQVAADPVLRDGHGKLPVLPRVPMSELPKSKYLLNLDGHTAAYRLGHLLATNSLVLKQESAQVEYYYKSLRAYHHYVPILKQSEHDVIPRLQWARQHPAQVRHIISNANKFALHYVTYPARLLYWKYVLLAYRSLVPDMGDYFKQSAATGTQMELLLKSQLASILRHQGAGINSTLVIAAGNGSISGAGGSNLRGPAVQMQLETVAELTGEETGGEEDTGALAELGGDQALLSLAGGDY